MKLLTFGGPGHFLEVPGFFTIARGESHEIDDHIAEAVVRANPDIDLTITDLPAAKSGASKRRVHDGEESQPAAQEGEGRSMDSTDKEE